MSTYLQTKAGVVGAYTSKTLFFSVNNSLHLHVPGCEDLWFELKFLGPKENYIFAVVYRHPHNNSTSFIDMLEEKLNTPNRKQKKFLYLVI